MTDFPKNLPTYNLAIFASGSGSNAENIYRYFLDKNVQVKYLVCNRPDAGVINRFAHTGVETLLIKKSDLTSEEFIAKMKNCDLLILAGFLVLIPPPLIAAFPDKIINIHPSLLPKYGGKGMYGDHVHKAALDHRENEHGITIHYVNEEFDRGEIIFQTKFDIETEDTFETIKDKIHQLEMEFYPKVIEELLN